MVRNIYANYYVNDTKVRCDGMKSAGVQQWERVMVKTLNELEVKLLLNV